MGVLDADGVLEAIRLFSHRLDDEATSITELRLYELATELRVLLGIDGGEAQSEAVSAEMERRTA